MLLALAAMLSVAAVLLASTAFFALQNLDRYSDDIAARLGQALGQPVSIGKATVRWQGATPMLRIEQLRLSGGADGEGMGFSLAELRIDPLDSLRRRTLHLAGIRIVGASVQVQRDAGGALQLIGFGNAEDSLDMQALHGLLAGPARLTLSAARLIYLSNPAQTRPVDLALDLIIQRGDSGQHLSGAVRLPGRSQSYVVLDGSFALPPDGDDWLVDLRLQSSGVLAHDIAALLPQLRLPGAEMVASFDLTLRVGARRPLSLEGPVAVRNLSLRPDQPLSGPRSAQAELQLRQRSDGWAVDAREIRVRGARQAWQASHGSLSYRHAGDDQTPRYSATLTRGRVEDLVALLAFAEPGDEDIEELFALQASGDVSDLHVAWLDRPRGQDAPAPPPAVTPFNLGGHLHAVSWPESTRNWGVQGLAGALQLTHQGGRLDIDARGDVQVEASDLFSEPLRFESARGALDIDIAAHATTYRSAALRLDGSQLALTVAGSVADDGQPSMLVDVRVEVDTFDTSTMVGLLPSPRFGSGFNRWLREAVVGGTVTGTRIQARGRADQIDVASAADSLEVRMQVQDLELAYAPDWPPATGLAGDLTLANGELRATSTAGRMGDLEARLELGIEALGASDPRLRLATRLAGSTAAVLDTMKGLPVLRGEARETLAALRGEGDVELELEVDYQLGSRRNDVAGRMRFKAASLAHRDPVLPALSGVNGAVTLRDGLVRLEDLRLQVLGRPARVSGELAVSEQLRGKVRLDTRAGIADWLQLSRRLTGSEQPPPAWLAQLPGDADWSLGATFEPDKTPALELRSDLRGIGVRLPEPFGKPAASGRELTLRGSLASAAPLRFGYGGLVSGLVLPATEQPAGVAVRFGDGAIPQASPGVWRLRGHIERLDLGAVRDLVEQQPGAADAGFDRSVLDVQLRIGRLMIGSVPFDGLDLAYPVDGGEGPPAVGLASRTLAGRVLPPATPQDPIGIELNHLMLPDLLDEASAAASSLDPGSLPPVNLSVRELSYAGRALGTLKFVARPVDGGVALDKMYLINSGFDAQGRAHWTLRDGVHSTRLEASVHADEMAALLRAVGHTEDTTRGGATQIQVNAHWDTPPAEAQLANMDGEVEFQASQGTFLDLRPGAGARIFGLLNLQSLPRLLSLDFRQLFNKGFDYQNIYGRFQVEDGHAYTNSLAVEAESARITVAGRTGLVSEDYDQIVTVTPKLTDSLPVAGAAFGGVGAGVGAAIWLVEQVLQTDIVDQVASFRYRVNGNWDNPVVERIKETETSAGDR